MNISCVANFNVLQDKLYTIPSFQLKGNLILICSVAPYANSIDMTTEKANYVMTISQKSGDVIYKSSPLKQKDHFSKLFPLEVRFSLQSAEENFIDSLLLSFDDPSGVSTGQVYSIPFSKESAKDVQLTEWLSVNLSTSVLPVTAVQSVESMRSLGSSASLETTASKKKSLFNFRKRK